MSFFISDNLKGLITEEDLVIDLEKNSDLFMQIDNIKFDIVNIGFKKDVHHITIREEIDKVGKLLKFKDNIDIALCIGNTNINVTSCKLVIVDISKIDNSSLADVNILIMHKGEL